MIFANNFVQKIPQRSLFWIKFSKFHDLWEPQHSVNHRVKMHQSQSKTTEQGYRLLFILLWWSQMRQAARLNFTSSPSPAHYIICTSLLQNVQDVYILARQCHCLKKFVAWKWTRFCHTLLLLRFYFVAHIVLERTVNPVLYISISLVVTGRISAYLFYFSSGGSAYNFSESSSWHIPTHTHSTPQHYPPTLVS